MKLKQGDILSVVTGTGADVNVHVSYTDKAGQQPFIDGRLNTSITTNTTTTVLSGPTSGQSVVRHITALIIRNVDVTSQTLTVKHNDGTTNVEVYKAVILAGGQIQWTEDSGWQLSTTLASGATLITAPADVANSAADTLADFTGLTYAVDAGDKYRFRAVCHFSADATTSGSRWTINGPAATAASTGYSSTVSLTATTQTTNHGLAAVQLPAAASASSAATTGNIAIVEGYYTPSTAGTFAIQFAAEAGTITGLKGSTLEIMKVVDA
jgi:hypothetical protein